MENPPEKPIEVRPIRDVFELWEVYRLTHDCYVETGYIRPRPTGLLVHYAEFDHIPQTTILVALQDNEIVGSLSYTIDGPSGFIIEKDYRKECQNIRQEGRWMADYWRFVVKKSCRAGRQVAMALMVYSGQMLLLKGVMTFFLDVHEKHEEAYRRLYNGVSIARRVGVPGLERQHIAAVLLRWDVERLPQRWIDRLPIRTPASPPFLPPWEPSTLQSGMENAKPLAEQYEQCIQGARQRFNNSSVVRTLTSPDVDEKIVIPFLINYCAYGVGITKLIESWIRKAVKQCEALGFKHQANGLATHANHEVVHQRMLLADVEALVAFWNERHESHQFSAEALLARPRPKGVLQYQKLHEDIAAGPEIFRQFSVKYEIDRLSLEYGAWLLKWCVQKFGPSILARLSFIQKNVTLDLGHTQFNWLELGKLLAAHPEQLDSLVETGTSALEAYQQILEDCLAASQKMAENPK